MCVNSWRKLQINPANLILYRHGYCDNEVVDNITTIINNSLTSSCVPQDYKLAVVKPLLKKAGLPLVKENYRPISNLPYVSKLIERAVLDQLLQHMKRNDLFEPFQSAYRVGHSTETALLAVQNDVLMAMDRQEVVALILLDMSAAFDTVSHTVLLQRMSDRLNNIKRTKMVSFLPH